MSKPKLGFCELLERAAEVLEREAASLRESHSYQGRWAGEHKKEARSDFMEMTSLARGLRRAHKYAKPNPLGGPAVIFDACANAIRAGDSIESAMIDFGLKFKHRKEPPHA